MSMERSIFQALIVLGTSADEVADRLAALGFKGRRGVAGDCPLARYLTETLRRRVHVGTIEVYPLGWTNGFLLPSACRDFVALLDEGKWPLLEEEVAHAPECPNLPDFCTCER